MSPEFFSRWWTYQRERFPVAAHGVLIAAFSFSAVCFSALLRGSTSLPEWRSVVTAFVTCFLFFLQLRIADEFKDFEEDSRWRPYRPVPRGLVSLRELGVLFGLCALVQLGLALWLDARLVMLLAATWIYLALMTREFFVREWLKGRPVVYMTSHMLIMPLIDLYATASDWLPAGGFPPPSGLFWFLLASYFNGLVIEVGRKIRVPADEEEGVETYSALWGRGAALLVWRGVLASTALCAVAAAGRLRFGGPMLILAMAALLGATFLGRRVLDSKTPGAGKKVELFSGVWTLALYATLGIIPMLVRVYA